MFSRKNTSGMTLIEMLVLISLYTLLIIVITQSVAAIYRANNYTMTQANEVEFARHGIERAVRDVREMNFADDGAFPLLITEPHRLGFYSDIDRDDRIEYVEFVLDDTVFEKRVHDPIGNPPVYNTSVPDQVITLSQHVQNDPENITTFEYFRLDGTTYVPSTDITEVRYIVSSLLINVDSEQEPGGFLLRSSVAPRNLKDNF